MSEHVNENELVVVATITLQNDNAKVQQFLTDFYAQEGITLTTRLLNKWFIDLVYDDTNYDADIVVEMLQSIKHEALAEYGISSLVIYGA